MTRRNRTACDILGGIDNMVRLLMEAWDRQEDVEITPYYITTNNLDLLPSPRLFSARTRYYWEKRMKRTNDDPASDNSDVAIIVYIKLEAMKQLNRRIGEGNYLVTTK